MQSHPRKWCYHPIVVDPLVAQQLRDPLHPYDQQFSFCELHRGIHSGLELWSTLFVVIESLIIALKALFATLPDRRKGDNTSYSMTDIGMGAFGVFFMQSPSFLSHQTALERGRGTSNCQTLLGMDKIPTENHIRTRLDPVPPETLYPMFAHTLAAIETGGGLDTFKRLGLAGGEQAKGHVLIAFDGTEYFCSQKLDCPNCSSRARANGKTEHFHQMVCAVIVAPGIDRASWRSRAPHGRRWSRSSSRRKTVPTSRTARRAPRTAGSPHTARRMRI